MNISSQLVSKLGSPNSKIPLAVKDLCNSAGCTYFSYDAGGAIEGKDRLIDEVGTGALWLFGIPAYKKLIDMTLFKKAGLDPAVDVRVVKNSAYFKKAVENAPTDTIKKSLTDAGKNLGKTKSLNIAKFGIAMGLTMLSYFGLTKFKQEITKKNIEKEYIAKQMNKTVLTHNYELFEKSNVFSEIEQPKKQKNPSFGSAAVIKAAEEMMLNPVKNMMLLDMGISAERLSGARTKGEFAEYAIKEGSFLFFVYGADKMIKKGIDFAAEKLFKTPIGLDAKLISSDYAKDILKNSKLKTQVKEFTQKFSSNTDINALYDFIFKNQTHPVVEAAKQSGIISTIKTKSGDVLIDTRKYIDPKDIQKLTKELNKFIDFKEPSKQTVSKYLDKIKGLKVASTVLNIGLCCLALGYIVPKAMFKYREKHQNGKNDFHVKTEYEKELAKKNLCTL